MATPKPIPLDQLTFAQWWAWWGWKWAIGLGVFMAAAVWIVWGAARDRRREERQRQ